MSSFFCLYNRDERPVDLEYLGYLHNGASYWHPDSNQIWCQNHIGLGHASLWTTPESQLENLPYQHGPLTITLDARLDNRLELRQKLGLVNRPLPQIADSELILAAYQRWGTDCPGHLLGDFAFVIVDDTQNLIFCARDQLGVKPFYFYLSESLFVCANDLKVLTAHPDIPKKLNDAAVANYLVNMLLVDKSLSFFQDIEKLPPGHSLTIRPDSHSRQCYWRPEDAPKQSYPNRKAYAARLRELLEQAVEAQSRSTYPITTHLSGGLDSSTIAVIAARNLKKDGKKLLAFNWLHPPGENEDPNNWEFAYSQAVAEQEEIAHHFVPISAEDVIRRIRQHIIVYGDSAGFVYEDFVRSAAQEHNSRTILSGWGGDELCTYHGNAYFADMLRHGHWWKLFQELSHTNQQGKKHIKSLLAHCYHHALLPFIPRRLYRHMPKVKSEMKMTAALASQSFSPYLTEAIQHHQNDAVLTMQPQTTIKGHMLAYLDNGHIQGRMESWAASAFANRLEYSYPLLDRRIVEFLLGTPATMFYHQGIGRHLFRSATTGLLPDEITWGQKRPEMHRVYRLLSFNLTACQLIYPELTDSPCSSRYGDLIKIGQALSSACANHEEEKTRELVEIVNLMTIILCERNL